MKDKLTTIKELRYKGHVIREAENEFGCRMVLIDNDSDEREDAPILCAENEFTYASIADARRAINGQPMKWIPADAEVWGERYYKRFTR